MMTYKHSNSSHGYQYECYGDGLIDMTPSIVNMIGLKFGLELKR
jgi:hypothetical protein